MHDSEGLSSDSASPTVFGTPRLKISVFLRSCFAFPGPSPQRVHESPASAAVEATSASTDDVEGVAVRASDLHPLRILKNDVIKCFFLLAAVLYTAVSGLNS